MSDNEDDAKKPDDQKQLSDEKTPSEQPTGARQPPPEMPLHRKEEKRQSKRLSKREKRVKRLATKEQSYFFQKLPSVSSSSSSSDSSSDDDTGIPKISVDEGETHITFDDIDDDDDDDDDYDITKSKSRRASRAIVLPRRSLTPARTPETSVPEEIVETVDADQQEPTSFEIMEPTVRKRTTVTLKKAVKELTKVDMLGYISIEAGEAREETKTEKAINNVSDPESSVIRYPTAMEPPPMSNELKRGTKLGTMLSQNFLLPGMPKLLGDIWVFVELSITLFQLIFSLVNMQISSNKVFNGLYISLAGINTVLSCIDTFLYFYELGSCKSFYYWIKGIEKEEEEEEEENEGQKQEKNLCSCIPCCKVPDKVLKFFNKWFEILRTILGELLIYPLVVLDLFDLLAGGSFHPTSTTSRVSFSMFIIGCFYLVLSVYIGRAVMSIITIQSLQGLTATTKNDSSYTRVFVRFLFHTLTQIVVHLLCVISVGIKIWQENKFTNGGEFRASPLLWAVIFGGWIIPFMGVVSYFVVNYYWIRSFSIGMFIDMIGLLEEQDFAEAVFQSKNAMSEAAKEKSEKLLEDLSFSKVKVEAKERNELTNPVAKIMYPLKVPIFLMFGIFFDFVIGGFIASLLLEYDKHSNIQVINFTTTTGMATVVTVVLVILSNLHIVVVINIWMGMILLGLAIGLLGSPVLATIGIIMFTRRCRRKKEDQELPLLPS